ncbi:MAG: hypothetical protein JWO92_2463 [Chitinophagaceae bacterium]|nr:hypothetical protein [Chitinophagaceae bacterium]MDB5223665.1 hypothetical protein [Chitinophagaceae bacterium]
MMKKLFSYCIIIAVLTSCAPSQKALDAKEDALFNKWLNYSKARLIQTWGQPDSIVTDGKGGEILIYKEGVDYKSVMNGKYTGAQFSVRKQMYVNADSTIYYWKAWRRK